MGRALPAIGHHHKGGDKLGHRSPDIARAKNSQHRALLARAVPARDRGHPDDERPARKPDAQGCNPISRAGRGPGQRPGRHPRQNHLQRKHQPPALPFRPNPQKQPRQRPGQDRCRHQQAEFKLAQRQLFLDRHTDD